MSVPGNRICVTALLLSAAALIAPAQDNAIGVDTKASSTQIRSWLASDDPRLVAWGAYFAGKNQDATALPSMIEFVDAWKPPESATDAEANLRKPAMTEVLDALIQENAQVPAESLAGIANEFPEQAAILAARLPIADATPLLQTWYAKRADDTHPLLARIAAMLLSKSPLPGFAASVLAEAHEQYYVTIVDPGVGFGFGGGYGCCVSLVGKPPTGWPLLFSYALGENSVDPNAMLLVEAGGDRISYVRTQRSPCRSVEGLDDRTRHALLAEMLGIDKDAMSWKPWQRDTYAWEGPGGYLLYLGELVEREETHLRDTVSGLADKGLLTPQEGATLRPSLSVIIDDDRGVKDHLPQFESRDPRTKIVDQTLMLTAKPGPPPAVTFLPSAP
jgi:hypothetical protein